MPSGTDPLPTIHRLRPDAFYGWFVVAGTFVLSFVSVGIGFYGQTVFLDGLIHEKGWSQASVSGASTLFFMFTGVAGVAVGRAVDRWGSRRMLLAGALTMASALLLLGLVRQIWQLYLVYALLATSFAMSAAIPLSNLVNRWFVARRARAMSFAQTGVSFGGLVLVPVATGMIARYGMRDATLALAALVIVVALPVVVFVILDDPGAHGLQPDGGMRANVGAVPTERRWRATEALRTSTFVLVSGAFAAILLCQTGVAVHHLHLLRAHLSTSAAALGAATIPLGSIIGRLLAGRVADHFEKRKVAAVLFAFQGLAILALSFAERPPGLLTASVCFGLTIGAVFMMQGLLIADLFGAPSYGTVFGVMNLVTGIGGGLGPITLGVLAEFMGGYAPALRVLLFIAPLAALFVLRVRPPHGER
jgi:MFS family permease